MNILIVSSYLPYPLFDGGSIRLYNLIKELSKKHTITLVCEIRNHQSEVDVKEIKKFCEEVIVIPHQKPWSVQNILKTGFSFFPLLLVMHSSGEMKKRIVQVLNSKRFDVIHVETFYVMQNLPKTYLPVVLVEHNIEYLVYSRYAKTAKFYLKPFLYADIAKMAYWEKRFWKSVTTLCAVTEEEKYAMHIPDVVVVPNGVDIDVFKKQSLKGKNKEKRILFMGNFKWIQNIDSIRWIIKDIWPIILEKRTDLTSKLLLWVVGKEMTADLKALGTHSSAVLFDEHAPDETWKIYQKSYVLLAPIKVGGGSSYKIIEAMASGVPVVTTDLAARALGARHRKHLLVGKNSGELAKATIELLENDTLYETISHNARQLIESTYSWKYIASILENVYQKAVLP